jgi:hypothetical protein
VRGEVCEIRRFQYPVVGELSLAFESMELQAGQGQTPIACTAEPGSRSRDVLNCSRAGPATVDQRRPRSMDYERQWLVDMLRHLGRAQAAADAAREMPERFSSEELEDFAKRHGIQSRDELIDLMGGSP